MEEAESDGTQPSVSALRANRAGDSQGQWAWEEPLDRAKCMSTGLKSEVERGATLFAVRGLFSDFTAFAQAVDPL